MSRRRLRVMVDARMLIGRFSGVARFTTRLVDELVKQEDIEVVALCAREVYPAWRDRRDVEIIASSYGRRDRTAARRLLWEELHLRRIIRRSGVDLFHATWNSGIAARCPVPAVLTVHDLIPMHDPESYFNSAIQRLCYEYALGSSARRASVITAVSEYVHREIIEQLGVAPERVVCVRNGVTALSDAPADEQPASRPYVLYVGGHEHRKNLVAVFAAMERYWERYDGGLELRLTGDASSLKHDASTAFDRVRHRGPVRFLGEIEDGELAAQYRNARTLLTLSRDEGFGLPVLEAMVHGCPVVAAANASLPEVVGDAGVLVDGDNRDEVAAAVYRMVNDQSHRSEYLRRGAARARAFGWDAVALRMREVYERVLSASVRSPVPLVSTFPDQAAPAAVSPEGRWGDESVDAGPGVRRRSPSGVRAGIDPPTEGPWSGAASRRGGSSRGTVSAGDRAWARTAPGASMHCVFFVTRYWPAVGGVEKYIRELGKALVAMGHRVTVVAGAHEAGLPEEEMHEGIEVYRYPAYRSRLRCWLRLMQLRQLFMQADVVHISDVIMVEYYYRMLGWTLRRRPVFLTRHGLSYQCPVPVDEHRRAARAAEFVDGTVDDGRFIAKWLQVPSDVIIAQGLAPPADEIEQDPEPPPNSAVFVGRLDWDSGITTYIDAIAVLRDRHGMQVTLEVYGGGGLEEQLRSRVDRDRLPVRFHGFVEGAQNRLSNGCFAFVSGRLAIQEAMARRRLVIATHVNELKRDYVSEEPFSPYLEIGATAEEVAEKVVYFANHSQERSHRIERAFAHARTLTWTHTARGYMALWRRQSVGAPAVSRWLERATLAMQLCEEAR